MKILIVNKFHWNKGGSETYYFGLGEMLKSKGHEVAYFSMDNDKNIFTGEKEYFVKKSDMNSKNIFKAFQVIYNKKNEKTMEQVIDDFNPDIVHLNNFQRQLSASIIKPCIKRNIPIVFTAHDVQAICPAILMIDSKQNICEECMHHKYSNCIKKKCIKESLLKSILGAYENRYYYKKKIYTDKINYIITPSEFYRKKLIEDGISQDKIEAIHNFINLNKYNVKTSDDGYALYFGRLSREKGIFNLIKAFAKTKNGKLYIAGTGPEEENIKELIYQNNLQDRIKLLGFLNRDEMLEVTKKCKFVVIPSIWYENCPYSAIETQAIGKPIVGANIGGIPELVINNMNGLTYKYDDINELADKLNLLFNDKKLVDKLSKNAKEYASKEYSIDNYYKKIIKIYEKLKGSK